MKYALVAGCMLLLTSAPVLAEQGTITEDENSVTVEYNGAADAASPPTQNAPVEQGAAKPGNGDLKEDPAAQNAATDPVQDRTPSAKERRSQLQAIKDAQREQMIRTMQNPDIKPK